MSKQNQKLKIDNCCTPDENAVALQEWAERISTWGAVLCFLLCVIAIIVSLVSSISMKAVSYSKVEPEMDTAIFFMTLLHWSVYIFVEVVIYKFAYAVLSGIASIVQSSANTARLAKHMAMAQEGLLDFHAEEAAKEAKEPSGEKIAVVKESDATPVKPTAPDIICPECWRRISEFPCEHCGFDPNINPRLIPAKVHADGDSITCPSCGLKQPSNRFCCFSCKQIFINHQPTIPYWCETCGAVGPFESNRCPHCGSASRLFNE